MNKELLEERISNNWTNGADVRALMQEVEALTKERDNSQIDLERLQWLKKRFAVSESESGPEHYCSIRNWLHPKQTNSPTFEEAIDAAINARKVKGCK